MCSKHLEYLLSSCLACCGHLKLPQFVDCSVYDVKSMLGSAFLFACCTGFDAVRGSRWCGVCFSGYAVGVLETGINKINENNKDSSTGK